MGIALGIPIAEVIGEAMAGILGADAAAGAAAIAADAAAAGESATVVIGDTIGLTSEESAAMEKSIAKYLAEGGTKDGIGAAAVRAYSKIISGNLADLLAEDTAEAAAEISDEIAAGAEIGANLSPELQELVDEGVISEEAAAEIEQINRVTDADLRAVNITREAFDVLDIETEEVFTELSQETKTWFEKLKSLGKLVTDLIKKSVLACKKNKITLVLCAAELTELIHGLYSQFFSKSNSSVINFVGADAYKIGTQVGNIVSKAIGKYYDKVVADPSIGKQEVILEHMIIDAFKETATEVNDTIARTIYGLIRTSKFLVGPETKKRFDEIFSKYDGQFIAQPFRDPKTKFITYTDEVGAEFSYKGTINPTSRTTLYGTWVGPKSYNDTIPLSDIGTPEAGHKVRRSGSGLLDTYAFAHDISYDRKSFPGGSYFNQKGDFQFVSRILHNMSKMSAQEQVVAHATVGWFSSIGMILNTLIHPLVSTFDGPDPINDIVSYAGDIYSLLFKEKKKKALHGQIVLQGHGAKNTQYADDKKKFYRGLKDTLEEQQVDFNKGNGAGGGGQSNNYSSLLQAFDSIQTHKC